MDFSHELSQGWHQLNRLWTKQLYKEYENICFHFRLHLRKPVLNIESMESRWGSWDPRSRVITIARELIEKHDWDAVVEVLKHEMAHQIVNEFYQIPDHTHGEHFRRACNELGISPWASASEGDMRKPITSWKERSLCPKEERLLKRVEKLLALASSSNENEAVLAMQKVRDLYSTYNIERLQANQVAEQVYVLINHQQKRVPQHQSMIAGILTSHFFVEVIFSTLFDAKTCTNHKVMEIMGTPENVQMAEYVYHFLQHALSDLWGQYKRQSNVSGHSRSSFYLGVLTGFDEKLRRESRAVSKNGTTWTCENNPETQALIRRSDQELQTYVRYRHPRLVTRRWGSALKDAQSFEHGKTEGQKLTIHKAITRKSGGEVRLLR